jgi:hypothetical protein
MMPAELCGFTGVRSRIHAPTRSRTTPMINATLLPPRERTKTTAPIASQRHAGCEHNVRPALPGDWPLEFLRRARFERSPWMAIAGSRLPHHIGVLAVRRCGLGCLNSRCSELRVVDREAAGTKTVCRLRGAESADREGAGHRLFEGEETVLHVMG